jgi:hypothetical protein
MSAKQISLDLDGGTPIQIIEDVISSNSYQIEENWNFKLRNKIFCEVIPTDKFNAGRDMGREFTFTRKGQVLCEATVIGCQITNKSDVITTNMPSMLMNLAFGTNSSSYKERLDNLPEQFYFVLFEKKIQMSIFD